MILSIAGPAQEVAAKRKTSAATTGMIRFIWAPFGNFVLSYSTGRKRSKAEETAKEIRAQGCVEEDHEKQLDKQVGVSNIKHEKGNTNTLKGG